MASVADTQLDTQTDLDTQSEPSEPPMVPNVFEEDLPRKPVTDQTGPIMMTARKMPENTAWMLSNILARVPDEAFGANGFDIGLSEEAQWDK